jgi:hypothetical protein
VLIAIGKRMAAGLMLNRFASFTILDDFCRS